MGMMYKEGVGVSQDLIVAYALLDLATRDGHGEARKAQREVEVNLDESQLAEAKALAEQWKQAQPITIPTS